MEKKTLGAFIAVLRKAKGLTQQELADKLCVSNKAVSKWECEETCPDISLLPVIAEVLEVSCDELLRGERILSEDKSEKAEKRGEKQLTNLVNKFLFKYKNISLISIALVVIGLIVMYSVSYSAYRADIGFAVAVCLFFAAILLQIFSIGWLNNKTADNEIFEKKEKSEGGGLDESSLPKRIADTLFKYSFAIFYSVILAVFLILPLVVFRDNVIIKSVLTFKSYLEFVPIFMIMPISLAFAARGLCKKLMLKNADKSKAGLLVFDFVQTVALAILCLPGYISLFSTTMFPGFGLYIYVILGFSACIAAVAIKTKNKQATAKAAAITLRNIGFLIALMIFFASVYRTEGEGYVYYGHNIGGDKSLISGIIIVLTAVVFIALTKSKNIYEYKNK